MNDIIISTQEDMYRSPVTCLGYHDGKLFYDLRNFFIFPVEVAECSNAFAVYGRGMDYVRWIEEHMDRCFEDGLTFDHLSEDITIKSMIRIGRLHKRSERT